MVADTRLKVKEARATQCVLLRSARDSAVMAIWATMVPCTSLVSAEYGVNQGAVTHSNSNNTAVILGKLFEFHCIQFVCALQHSHLYSPYVAIAKKPQDRSHNTVTSCEEDSAFIDRCDGSRGSKCEMNHGKHRLNDGEGHFGHFAETYGSSM